MFLQDPGGVVGPLALPHGAEACPLGGQVQAADAGKQGKVGQFHISYPSYGLSRDQSQVCPPCHSVVK